jgi:hypothetical protein
VSRDSPTSIAPGHGPDDWGSRTRLPAGAGDPPPHHRPKRLRGPPRPPPNGHQGPPRSKAAEKRSRPPTPIQCRGQRMRGATPPLPNTPPWRGAHPSTGTNYTSKNLASSRVKLLQQGDCQLWGTHVCCLGTVLPLDLSAVLLKQLLPK